MIEVVQLNQNKAFAAAVELNRNLTKSGNYICLISEPFKAKCRIIARPHHSKVLYVRNATPPRTAIYFKGEFDIIMLETLCNRDCTVGILNTGRKKILIGSIYLDINLEVKPAWLTAVHEYARKKGLPLLLGMDSNAHSDLFGNETNKRGEELEDYTPAEMFSCQRLKIVSMIGLIKELSA